MGTNSHLPRRGLQARVPERIEQCSQLSKNIYMEQNGEVVKPPDKSLKKSSDIQRTEVNALNMEVETLRWQLAQTEANRQMHIALLKQIVTFLNRVKEHIECQRSETKKEGQSARALPKSFNLADLPRSRNQSKMSLVPENETAQKITEEMSRLITLANTVLSTKLPDLACACTDTVEMPAIKLNEDGNESSDVPSLTSSALNLIKEDCGDTSTVCNSITYIESITKVDEAECKRLEAFAPSLSPVICDVEHGIKLFEKGQSDRIGMESPIGIMSQNAIDKRNEYNGAANFVEDESGFSSMSSFQEIGIPIISIIPPSPCKEVGYLEEIPDIIEENEKWKTNAIEIDKQNVKVFWV